MELVYPKNVLQKIKLISLIFSNINMSYCKIIVVFKIHNVIDQELSTVLDVDYHR